MLLAILIVNSNVLVSRLRPLQPCSLNHDISERHLCCHETIHSLSPFDDMLYSLFRNSNCLYWFSHFEKALRKNLENSMQYGNITLDIIRGWEVSDFISAYTTLSSLSCVEIMVQFFIVILIFRGLVQLSQSNSAHRWAYRRGLYSCGIFQVLYQLTSCSSEFIYIVKSQFRNLRCSFSLQQSKYAVQVGQLICGICF